MSIAAPGPVAAAEATKAGELGAELLSAGKITVGALKRAEVHAQTRGMSVAEALLDLQLTTDEDIALAEAIVHGLELVGADDYPAQPLFGAHVRPRFLRQAQMLPIRDEGDQVIVAAAEPGNAAALKALRVALGREVIVRVGLRKDIDHAFTRLFDSGDMPAVAGIGTELPDLDLPAEPETQAEPSARVEIKSGDAAVVRMANGLIAAAIEAQAREIHIEPSPGRLRVRYRTADALTEVPAPARANQEAVLARLKTMAGIDHASPSTVRDGHFQVSLRGSPTEVHMTAVPTPNGDTLLLRLNKRDAAVRDLGDLGLSKTALAAAEALEQNASGLVLFAGQPDSGVDEALWSMVKALRAAHRKIVALCDGTAPLLESVTQIECGSGYALSQGEALSAALRLYPDVLVAGRLPGPDAAELSIDAALDGTLVLASLPAANAAGAVARMLRLGTPPTLLAQALSGIVVPRRIRRLCRTCRMPAEASPDLLARLARYGQPTEGRAILYAPLGCPACHSTGYDGSFFIAEVMRMTGDMRAVIERGAAPRELEDAAVANGMVRLAHEGFAKAASGEASLDDILKAARL